MTEEVTDVPFTEDEVNIIHMLMRNNEVGQDRYQLHGCSENEYNQLDLPGGFAIQKLSNGFFDVSRFEQRGGGSYENPPYDEHVFEDVTAKTIDQAIIVYFKSYMELMVNGYMESYRLQQEFEEDKKRHLEDH